MTYKRALIEIRSLENLSHEDAIIRYLDIFDYYIKKTGLSICSKDIVDHVKQTRKLYERQ